jgi:hypothetical protein
VESYEQVPETARESEPGGVPRDDELVPECDARAHGEIPGEAERAPDVDPDRDPEAADPAGGADDGGLNRGIDNPREIQGGL